MQRALMHYFKPGNRALVIKALRRAGREDLIGRGRDCLVAPDGREQGADRKPARPDGPPRRGAAKSPNQPKRPDGRHSKAKARHTANGRKPR